MGKYYNIKTVYQAIVGHHHYGLWMSEDEARKHIKEYDPEAQELLERPISLDSIPDGNFLSNQEHSIVIKNLRS